jgi:hypothetical protein
MAEPFTVDWLREGELKEIGQAFRSQSHECCIQRIEEGIGKSASALFHLIAICCGVVNGIACGRRVTKLYG